MMKDKRRVVKCGLGYVRDSTGSPVKWSRERAQREADRMAKSRAPAGFWNGVVYDASVFGIGDYYRINLAGQPENK